MATYPQFSTYRNIQDTTRKWKEKKGQTVNAKHSISAAQILKIPIAKATRVEALIERTGCRNN